MNASLSGSRGGGGRKGFGDFAGGHDGVDVNAHGVFDAASVTAGENGYDGNAALAGGFKNAAGALLQTFFCQHEAAELIFAERIGAADVEERIGRKLVKRLLDGRDECAEILVVVDTVGHVQIERRGWLVGGVVVFLMDGEREDCWIVREDRRRAITVMHVGIDYNGFANGAIGLQAADGYGDIVNGAEAFAVAGIRVMEAAAEIAAEAIARGRLRGENGAARGEPHGFDEFAGVRNFELHDFAGG